MKAIVYTQYGPPESLKLTEMPIPTPKADEVLVKVQFASVNAAEWHLLRADPFLVRLSTGLFKPSKPTIPGADIAGVVEAVGSAVTTFKRGDAVFGFGFGAYAEYVCARASKLAARPAAILPEQAAAIPIAGATALQGLRDVARVQAGQAVLINGAAGGVGTYAIQIAKALGAEVTAVCSTRKRDIPGALGADHVVDYSHEDITQGARRYDVVFDTALHRSFLDYARVLKPQGVYVMAGGGNKQLFQVLLTGALRSKKGGQRFTNFLARESGDDMAAIAALMTAGKVKSVIDRSYPLSAAGEALRYVEEGRARGKVIIQVA
jgi:NADPH:quinone reductase-like Zn-dependent oxidoreductase